MFLDTRSLMQQVVLLGALISQHAYADDVNIVGSVEQTFKILVPGTSVKSGTTAPQFKNKTIELLQIELSPEAQQHLTEQANLLSNPRPGIKTSVSTAYSALPKKANVGMNNVPVLNQGRHGTCVTFAVTGALDASLGRGDYISQLCNLELGNYLELHSYAISGWNGSSANAVINQITQYGVMSKPMQFAVGCGGLRQYPVSEAQNPKRFIEPTIFANLSEFVFGKQVNWTDVYKSNDGEGNLNAVKTALSSGDRLVFGVLFPRKDLGTVGATGKYKTWFVKDTWLLTSEILDDAKKGGIKTGHEMIITGYDDDAVVYDSNGNKHKGLLTLRNSWGTSTGNDGEFYMTYEYFKLLAIDVTRFSKGSN